jgi:hypothetical protein
MSGAEEGAAMKTEQELNADAVEFAASPWNESGKVFSHVVYYWHESAYADVVGWRRLGRYRSVEGANRKARSEAEAGRKCCVVEVILDDLDGRSKR